MLFDKLQCIIEKPILFNCIKHHFGYIRGVANKVQTEADLSDLSLQMLAAGNSRLDLYTGILSPGQIGKAIIQYLKENNRFEKEAYHKWLNENGGYHIIDISDSSKWTLRMGNIAERYIHVHPARYSPLTIRANSASIKTAAISYAWQIIHNIDRLPVEEINRIRKEYIRIPPLTTSLTSKKILFMIQQMKNGQNLSELPV